MQISFAISNDTDALDDALTAFRRARKCATRGTLITDIGDRTFTVSGKNRVKVREVGIEEEAADDEGSSRDDD